MCLWANKNSTEKFKKDHSGEITVWKMYERWKNKLYPPLFDTKCIKPGNIVSNRNTTRFPIKYETWALLHVHEEDISIKKGIHVFTTRKNARNFRDKSKDFRRGHYKTYVVVKCTANMKDFVACSKYGEAVFTKIHICPAEFERGLKNRN